MARGVWSSLLLWGTISIRLHHPDPQLRKQDTQSLQRVKRSSHVSPTSATLLALENPFNGRKEGEKEGRRKEMRKRPGKLETDMRKERCA